MPVPTADHLRHLAEAAAHGDDVALVHLVRHTQPLVWHVCTALGSPGEQEDLVQESYLRAVRSLRSYRGDAPVRSGELPSGTHLRPVTAGHPIKRPIERPGLDERRASSCRSMPA